MTLGVRDQRPPRTRTPRLFRPFPRLNGNGRSILLVTFSLLVYGTVCMISASEGQAAANGGSVFAFVKRDGAFLVIGLIAFYFVARIRMDLLVKSAPFLIVSGLVLLVAVEFIGITANGGKRWLGGPGVNIQPSEMFKLFTIIYLAWLVQHQYRELASWRVLLGWLSPVLGGIVLIVVEPDIGTSSVVAVLLFTMLFMAGLDWRKLTTMGAVGALGVLVYAKDKPYAVKRLLGFLHPSANPLSSGYQLAQSKIGLGSGGLSGLGLGHSREKWGFLPNPHTDFVFAIVGEELGFIGALAVLALFIWFLVSALKIARQTPNATYRLMVVGITTWIMFEAVINIASVVGWWAVTGIPLPFFSYGGTALIAQLVAVGLLVNIAHDPTPSPDFVIGRRLVPPRRSYPREY